MWARRAERQADSGVHVRMLVSLWNHSSADMFQYLTSLNALQNVDVQMFQVPGAPQSCATWRR
jgi:hypothetical protein